MKTLKREEIYANRYDIEEFIDAYSGVLGYPQPGVRLGRYSRLIVFG